MRKIGNDSQKNLKDIRKKIDSIDAKILILLSKRIRLSMQANIIKRGLHLPVRNPKREQEILKKSKREASKRKLPAHDVAQVFQKIITMCRKAQIESGRKNKKRS